MNVLQLDVLEEVVKAVQGRCDVFMDGGVRKGSDVLKALALGAKAVLVGRPVLWGLACQVMRYTAKLSLHLIISHAHGLYDSDAVSTIYCCHLSTNHKWV